MPRSGWRSCASRICYRCGTARPRGAPRRAAADGRREGHTAELEQQAMVIFVFFSTLLPWTLRAQMAGVSKRSSLKSCEIMQNQRLEPFPVSDPVIDPRADTGPPQM